MASKFPKAVTLVYLFTGRITYIAEADVTVLTRAVRNRVIGIALAAAFLLASANTASAALTGQFINASMTWDGITRYYQVYVPLNLPPNPAMVMMLHGTRHNAADAPPTNLNWGWWTLADKYHFIEVQPASTYNSKSGQWNWNSYYLDGAFQTQPGPDDSGFLRQLILNLTSQYALDPKRIYVAGFSAGAMMAERVGVEISDLVAAIVPASGQIVGDHTLPIVLPGPEISPVSVQEWQGTLDKGLPPCNHGWTKYSGYLVYMATVDETFNYWNQQNACTQLATTQPLCVGGSANPSVPGNDATGCTDNTEVQFIWEVGFGHQWVQSNNGARWQFFATHPKP
jgi:polyhydroxybutyrate depolymerase